MRSIQKAKVKPAGFIVSTLKGKVVVDGAKLLTGRGCRVCSGVVGASEDGASRVFRRGAVFCRRGENGEGVMPGRRCSLTCMCCTTGQAPVFVATLSEPTTAIAGPMAATSAEGPYVGDPEVW